MLRVLVHCAGSTGRCEADLRGFLLDMALYQMMSPGPGSFCRAICAAFTNSDPRKAVLSLLAAGSGPSRFISCALHHAEVTALLQDTSCASANKSSWAWGDLPWSSRGHLHLHGTAHVQPGPTTRRAPWKRFARPVPVHGWVAGGLLLFVETGRPCVEKKWAEGALPAARLLAITRGARVSAVMFEGGVRLWKPASACTESA